MGYEQMAFMYPPAAAEPHPLAVMPRATAAESQRHCDLIADLVRREGAWTVQFRKQVAQFLRTVSGMYEGGDGDINVPRIKPDAYRIDQLDDIYAKITIWEVEVRHDLPAWKKDLYAWWWFDLDAADELVELELFIVDKHGVQRRFNLCSHLYANTQRIYGRTAA